MEIIYTTDSVEGEPGPNVYWRGRPYEFLNLLLNAHKLGVSSGAAIKIEEMPNTRLAGVSSYQMTSSENGCTLVRLRDNGLVSDLDPKLWREFLHNVLSISFSSGFVYQELPVTTLIEEANVIMSSEAQ